MRQFMPVHPVNPHGSPTLFRVAGEAVDARTFFVIPIGPAVPVNTDWPADVIAMKIHEKVPAALEFTVAPKLMPDPVTVSAQAKHAPAQDHMRFQPGPGDVFDNEGLTGGLEGGDRRFNQSRMNFRALKTAYCLEAAVRLARRRSVYAVVFMAALTAVLDRVGLVKFEEIVRLRTYVDPYDIEAGEAVSHGGSAGAAIKV